MNQPLFKYKLGLAVLAVFSLVLLVLVISQAGDAKKDSATYRQASKVATDLDMYAVSHGPPDSLKAAGISNVPSEVSYRKLNANHYEFCVTYKSDSTAIDATAIETQILTGGAASKVYGTNGDETPYLYLNPSHHKGKNCQKVKTYEVPSYSTDAGFNYSGTPDTAVQSY